MLTKQRKMEVLRDYKRRLRNYIEVSDKEELTELEIEGIENEIQYINEELRELRTEPNRMLSDEYTIPIFSKLD